MGHVPSERIQAWFSLATTLDSADWEVRYYMGVEPKIRGILPPKWMVKIMENPMKMDDLGGKPSI